jgi:putative addiction module component (TIGR02574 family)
MTALAETLKPQLTALPCADRAELARFLLESLDQTTDPNAEQAWQTELMRRSEEIRSGQAQGRPVADAFADLRKRHS